METLPPELYTWKQIPFLTQDQMTDFDYFVDYHALIKSIQDSDTKVFALQGECQVYQYDNDNSIIWMTDNKFFLVTLNVSISLYFYSLSLFYRKFLHMNNNVNNIDLIILLSYYLIRRILYSRTSTKLLLLLYKIMERGRICLKSRIITTSQLDLL